jgi:hypothetical protein
MRQNVLLRYFRPHFRKRFALDSVCPTSLDNLRGVKNMRNFKSTDSMRPGLDAKLFPSERLFYWLIQPRNPVLASDDPLARMFIEAMLKNEPVEFIYFGGSKPGGPRKVNVSFVFQHEQDGRIYVAGFCQDRQANRVFALDLIMTIHAWN